MTLQKNDFIEIEFTARTKEGEVFDSNVKKDLEDANPNFDKSQAKPFIYSLGQGMFLKSVDEFLIGKEIGEYNIELTPEKAFGLRDSKLIQMIPMKVFKEQNINPVQGVTFNFDGRLAKILTVSSGRVMADFNNPISGKDVVYKIKVIRKVEDLEEKTKAFMNFIFKKEFKFKIKEKKLIIEVESELAQYIEMFKDKFKEILGLEIEVKKNEKETKKPQKTTKKPQ